MIQAQGVTKRFGANLALDPCHCGNKNRFDLWTHRLERCGKIDIFAHLGGYFAAGCGQRTD